MIILRGFTLFPYYDLGGDCGKFPTKMISSMGGGNLFFLKEKRKLKYAVGRSYDSCLLFGISTNVDTELEYET